MAERDPIIIDYTKIENVDVEPAIRDAMHQAQMDFFEYVVYVDKIGRIYATPEGGRKKAIGVIDPDGTVHITPPAKKTPKTKDRTSVTIYFHDPDYEKVARAAAVSGKNLSQFLRDIILEHYED